MKRKLLIFGLLAAILALGAGAVWAGEPDDGTGTRLDTGDTTDPDGDPDDGITGNRGPELIGDGPFDGDGTVGGDSVLPRLLPDEFAIRGLPGLTIFVGPVLF